MDEFLTLKQVSALLKLQHYRIHYALITHRIPEPALRVSNRRVFQHSDVVQIARHFGVTYPAAELQATPAN
jgi:hypothetical protein